MKSRTIEIIDNHIKALEDELEWYQEKNREWQEKCEKSDEEFHRCHKAYMIDTEYLTNKLAKCRDENARLREQLRWHSMDEFPPVDNTTERKRMSVDVLLKRPRYSTVIAWHIRDRNEWWSYDKGQILVPLGSRWCYIPDDNQGTDCTPEDGDA